MKRISPHLGRAPIEPVDGALREFYDRLLSVLRHSAVRDGNWQLLECSPGWEGNGTHESFLVFAWQIEDDAPIVVAVNFAGNRGQCHVRLPLAELAGKTWQLRDLLSPGSYDWNGDDLLGRGLFLDMAPWQASVLALAIHD
jgi:hypothetical protein